MLNQLILEARIVKNQGLKQSINGINYLPLIIVFDTLEKKDNKWNEKGNFIKAVLWGKKSLTLATHLKPGKQIIIRGKLEQKKWENENGEKRSNFSMTIEELHFVKNKKSKMMDN